MNKKTEASFTNNTKDNRQENTTVAASEDSFVVLSIGHAHTILTEAMQNRNYQLAKRIGKAVLLDDTICGEASDYHNLSVEFSRADDYLTAFMVVKKGLLQYPYNIDLLADGIYYGSNSKQYEACEELADTLLSRPFALWNWRAFTFLIDYYLGKSDWTEDTDKIFTFTDEALKIALAYQKVLSNNEKGFVAEYKIRSLRAQYCFCNKGEIEKAETEQKLSEDALKRAIDSKTFAAVQCCLSYADYLFEHQRYSEVVAICEQALQYGESQPSARIGYFLYLSAQSKDVLLHKERDFSNIERINDVFSDYMAAFKSVDSSTYKNNILNRVIILSSKSGVSVPNEFLTSTSLADQELSSLLLNALKNN